MTYLSEMLQVTIHNVCVDILFNSKKLQNSGYLLFWTLKNLFISNREHWKLASQLEFRNSLLIVSGKANTVF